MYRACIAVVDASRARLFSFVRVQEPEGIREELTEVQDFVDPVRRLRPSMVFSDTRPGSSRTGSVSYAFDDHRAANLDQSDAAFARMIAGAVAELLRTTLAPRLVVCASPNMLGAFRVAAKKLIPAEVTIEELPLDLVKLTPSQLREHLTTYELLPAPPPRPHV
jgi:protein required for attachment to host cells